MSEVEEEVLRTINILLESFSGLRKEKLECKVLALVLYESPAEGQV